MDQFKKMWLITWEKNIFFKRSKWCISILILLNTER
jgi:hypothetical protein